MNCKYLTTFFALSFLTLGTFATELDSAAFLQKVRFPAHQTATFAELSGTFQFKAENKPMDSYAINFNIKLNAPNIDAKLILDNEEIYKIKRENLATSIIGDQLGKPNTILAKTMLRPNDLATGFIFYNFLKEEEKKRISSVPCRVIVLESPDKKEIVRAYIAEEYIFVLKAEFFNSITELENDNPNRTLDIRSFKQQNSLYYAELINIYGQNWRSRIHFTEAKLGLVDTTEKAKENL